MKTSIKDLAKISLVDFGHDFMAKTKNCDSVVFFTIHPNDRVKLDYDVKVNEKTTHIYKRAYDTVPHNVQYAYLLKFLKTVYIPLINDDDFEFLYWCYETDTKNNMHIHGMFSNKSINDDYSIQAFRKSVLCHPLTQKNMIVSKAKKDWMNNIVYCTDVKETLNYCRKQNSIKKVYSDQYMTKEGLGFIEFKPEVKS